MTKKSAVLFIILWALALPIVTLIIGFAGSRLWLPSSVYEEVISGRVAGISIRVGLLLYLLSPLIVYRSYHKQMKQRN